MRQRSRSRSRRWRRSRSSHRSRDTAGKHLGRWKGIFIGQFGGDKGKAIAGNFNTGKGKGNTGTDKGGENGGGRRFHKKDHKTGH